MENNELRHIVEDHALIEDFIVHVSANIQEGKPMPEHIPSLHNALMMDALGNICECITKLRKKLL